MNILYYVDFSASPEDQARASQWRTERHRVYFRNARQFRLDEIESCERVVLADESMEAIAQAYRERGAEVEFLTGEVHEAPAAPLSDLFFDALNVMENDPDAWTDGGLPRLERLSALVGRKVSSVERDRAWIDYQALNNDGPNT